MKNLSSKKPQNLKVFINKSEKSADSKLDDTSRDLLVGSSVAFTIKILSAGAIFVYNVVLSIMLGASGVGLFFLAYTMIFIISTLSRFGFDNILIKQISIHSSEKDWASVNGVLKTAAMTTTVISSLMTVLITVYSKHIALYIFDKPELGPILSVMSFAICPFALNTLLSFALQGRQRVWQSHSVFGLWTPSISIIFSLLLVPYYGVMGAVVSFVGGSFAGLGIALYLWFAGSKQLRNLKSTYHFKENRASCIHFFWATFSQLVISWSSIIILGIVSDAESVGIFSVAGRTTMLISFIVLAVNNVASPKYATLYKAQDKASLHLVAKMSIKLMIIGSTPILVTFIIYPDIVLGLFGEEFIKGSLVLVVLAVGRFFNVITGPAGYLLNMTDHERLMKIVVSTVALFSLVLNVVLIFSFDLLGAAIATSVSVATLNVLAWYFVTKKLGILKLRKDF